MTSRVAPETNVGVLDKAMDIISLFQDGRMALTPAEIAKRIGLSVPTVYRLVQALHAHGLLQKEESRFRLGLTLLRLGTLVAEGMDVRTTVLPHLRWLQQQTGENAELHIRNEGTRVAVEMICSLHNLRPLVNIGEPLPLHLGAGGKQLLACLPEAEQEKQIAASCARFGSPRPFNAEELRAELVAIRKQGYALSDGERASDISAIAAPILDVHGQSVGSLVLAAPTIRLGASERERFVPLVREAARRSSCDLGYFDHSS
jgi:IclR family acetate operon transcriptional repressor